MERQYGLHKRIGTKDLASQIESGAQITNRGSFLRRCAWLAFYLMLSVPVSARGRNESPEFHDQTCSRFAWLVDNSHDVAKTLQALHDLPNSGCEAQASLPVLIKLLQAKDFSLRWAAIHKIGLMGSTACSAVPSLFSVLESNDTPCDLAAVNALSKLGKAVIPYAAHDLSHPNLGVRQLAAQVLASMGAEASSAVPALKEAVEREKLEVVRTILEQCLNEINNSVAAPSN